MGIRKVWFITRPERDPRFHIDALKALAESTNNFTIKWRGNRVAHHEYESVLNKRQIKRDNISTDGSGGRTWAAMLYTFGYIYVDSNGYIKPTKVALALLNGIKIRENVIKQLMTLQIPNAYFLSSGFSPKYDSDFRIRPARFLMELANQSELDYYITKKEITFFAMTAKKDSELSKITSNIVNYRNASETEKEKIENEISRIYDHRNRIDYTARNFEKAHGDVAHTFMMICEYTELVTYERGRSSRLVVSQKRGKKLSDSLYDFNLRYPFNTRYMISSERMAESNGLDVDSYKINSFSTGASPATNRGKTERKVEELLATLPSAFGLENEKLLEVLTTEFSHDQAKEILKEIREVGFASLNETFVESYLTENDALVFEQKTGDILHQLGFSLKMNPKPVEDVATEIEILVASEEKFGIIDAKCYSEKFHLAAHLASHMGSEYIPTYNGYDGKTISFFGYIVSNTHITGGNNLNKITKTARVILGSDIKGFIMSSVALIGFLDYCLENNIDPSKRAEYFIKLADNSIYKHLEDIIEKLVINSVL